MRVTSQSLWISNARLASWADVGRKIRRAVLIVERGTFLAFIPRHLAS